MATYTVVKSYLKKDPGGSPVLDKYGNHTYNITLQDSTGAEFFIFKNVKPGRTIKEGDTLQGSLEEKTSKAGGTYFAFTEERESTFKPLQSTLPFKDSASIERQVALKSAVELAGYHIAAGVDIKSTEVVRIASEFDKWLKEQA